MSRRVFGWVAAGLLTAGGAALLSPARAQGAARELYDFEQDAQGFNAILIKDSSLTPEAGALTVVTAKEQVKSGSGTLAWTYKAEPGQARVLLAEAKVPGQAKRLELHVKSTAATALMFNIREQDGSAYNLGFYVPAHEWTRVSANLDEFTLGENETDENRKLDLDQVASIGVMDVAQMLVNVPGIGEAPGLRSQRTLWLDDLRFAGEPAPVGFGAVKEGAKSSFVVDNFENDAVRWMPIRVVLSQPPTAELFPANTSVKALKEAAGPGAGKSPTEAGGRGLRFTYSRAAMELFALHRNLDQADVSKADRFRASLRMSQKSLVIISLKERDGSEYSHIIMPDQSEGWQSLDLVLSDFTLGNDSRDENNVLDAGQIKEISIVDASPFAGTLGNGETAMELDAVSFGLR